MGPQAYWFLPSCLTLPCKRSLRKCISDPKMTPGIIPRILPSLLTKSRSRRKRDRMWSLVLDVIILRKKICPMICHFMLSMGLRTMVLSEVRRLLAEPWLSCCYEFLGSGFNLLLIPLGTHPRHHLRLLVSLNTQLKYIVITVKAASCDQGACNVTLAPHWEVSGMLPFFNHKRWTYLLHLWCPTLNKGNA